MSDLIDFDSPSTNNVGLLLASPLIPAPEKSDASNSSNETAPSFSGCEKRHSVENNPFDMVMKKITDYEKNKEDPFEKVMEKAKKFDEIRPMESKANFSSRAESFDVLKISKTLNETDTKLGLPLKEARRGLISEESDTSIITDLNNTNLIDDNVDGREIVASWCCDNKSVPTVNIVPPLQVDLSILNNSAMNDSLLDLDSNSTKEIKNLLLNSNSPQSKSQDNFLSPKRLSPLKKKNQFLSVSGTSRINSLTEENSVTSTHSSMYEDPLNNAFRRSYSSSGYISNQFDLSSNKLKSERLNSDSSVFSGLSNISAIPADSMQRMRHDRFCSDSSIYSGISNLSIIPPSSASLSCNSSTFSNDTKNMGFITSNSQFNSTNSIRSEMSPLNSANKSDLLKKYYEIKTKMSSSAVEYDKSVSKENNNSKKEEFTHVSNEKLVDVDGSFNSVFNDDKEVDDIISNEAKALAETFEKMAASKDSNSLPEDELFFSKTQLNFDNLPPSDDEAVDNLIDLPVSPVKDTGTTDVAEETQSEATTYSPQDNIKALEREFIEQKDSDKKAAAATLLLNLEKLIKEENNPDAQKALNNLQKLLGVNCESNTEILKVCLQNNNSSPESERKVENETNTCKPVTGIKCEMNVLNKNLNKCSIKVNNETFEKKDSLEILENDEIKVEVKTENESIEIYTDSSQSLDKSTSNGSVQSQNSVNESSEDQKLAVNLLKTLNKIVNGETENSAADILRSLGTVLSMATELRTKNQSMCESEPKSEKPVPKALNRSTTSLYRSPSVKHISKSQNKSFEILPLRRSTSTIPLCNNNNILQVPQAKDKRKSHLLTNIRRFPSDPGFMNPTLDRKKNENSSMVKQKSNLETDKTTADPIKNKFKKKLSSEAVTKKGPLRAVIPLGNMQKRGSISHRITNVVEQVTPPKSQASVPILKIVSSTPNSSVTCKASKSKPTASSTPNVDTLRAQRANAHEKQNSKSTPMRNMSPMSLNSSPKDNLNSSRTTAKRLERTMTPQKRPVSPKKSDSKPALPKYSPRPVRVRNYSLQDLKTAKSPQPSSLPPKISSEKKIKNQSVLSPLRNCNKLAPKVKPTSLASRLGKPSRMQTGPEKENYA